MGKVLLKHLTRAPVEIILKQGIKSKFLVEGKGPYFQQFVYLSVIERLNDLAKYAEQDFVLVERSDQESCYDHEHKNDFDPISNRPTMTISNYLDKKKQGCRPFMGMPEVLVYNIVPPEQIVAFAKTEKIISCDQKYSKDDEQLLTQYINNKLSHYVYFEDSMNVGLHFEYGFLDSTKRGYYIRVIFNKEKVIGHEEEIKSFFESFYSLDELLNKIHASKINSQVDEEQEFKIDQPTNRYAISVLNIKNETMVAPILDDLVKKVSQYMLDHFGLFNTKSIQHPKSDCSEKIEFSL